MTWSDRLRWSFLRLILRPVSSALLWILSQPRSILQAYGWNGYQKGYYKECILVAKVTAALRLGMIWETVYDASQYNIMTPEFNNLMNKINGLWKEINWKILLWIQHYPSSGSTSVETRYEVISVEEWLTPVTGCEKRVVPAAEITC